MVEGGLPGFALFVAILGQILMKLARKNPFLFASFLAIATMNLFLHSYESTYISLLLFIITGFAIDHVSHKKRPAR